MNGPEPSTVVIFWSAGVSAIFAGIMNGTIELGLPSAASIRGYGLFNMIGKLFASSAVIVSVAAASRRPSGSCGSQRLSEAMQSAAVTAPPSCHFRPGRSVNVHRSLSSLSVQRSTICGFGVIVASTANSVS